MTRVYDVIGSRHMRVMYTCNKNQHKVLLLRELQEECKTDLNND